MKSNKMVSIIMTCHNGEAFLYEALRSIIDQTYLNWELIFFDNFSKDRSKEIVNRFKDNRIKYFKTDVLENLGTVRKLAYSKCNGSFICFLDVDDYWSKFKLEKQIIKFDSNEKIDAVYSNHSKILDNEINENKQNFVRGNIIDEIIKSYIDGSPLTPWLTLMIKKSSIEKLEYSFDNETHISSDFDLILRLSIFCYFDYVNENLAYYRLHINNESKNKKKNIEEFVYIIHKYEKNKIISKLFLYKNFLYKIYLKYFIIKKLHLDSFESFKIINNFNVKLLYYGIKIIPNRILNIFFKSLC